MKKKIGRGDIERIPIDDRFLVDIGGGRFVLLVLSRGQRNGSPTSLSGWRSGGTSLKKKIEKNEKKIEKKKI